MKNKSFSIVIPLYNESKRLKKTLSELQRLTLPAALNLEKVIFVNDGSTDKTVKILKTFILRASKARREADSSRLRSNNNVKNNYTLYVHTERSERATPYTLISYSQNMGKGHALRMGLRASTSDYTLICDADMSTPLAEINKFLKEMTKDTDILIGTRKNTHSTVIKHQSLLRESLGKGFTLLTKITLGINGTDFTCGFKAFSQTAKKAILESASINRWAYDAEWLLIAKRNNLTTKEVAVIWSNDRDTKVRLSKDVLNSVIELILIKKNDTLRQYAQVTQVLPTFAKNSA